MNQGGMPPNRDPVQCVEFSRNVDLLNCTGFTMLSDFGSWKRPMT